MTTLLGRLINEDTLRGEQAQLEALEDFAKELRQELDSFPTQYLGSVPFLADNAGHGKRVIGFSDQWPHAKVNPDVSPSEMARGLFTLFATSLLEPLTSGDLLAMKDGYWQRSKSSIYTTIMG